MVGNETRIIADVHFAETKENYRIDEYQLGAACGKDSERLR